MTDTAQLRMVEQLERLNRNMQRANDLSQQRNDLIENRIARLLLLMQKKGK